MGRHAWAVGIGLGVGLAWAPRMVAACSCAPPSAPAWPVDRSAAVPTNAPIWLRPDEVWVWESARSIEGNIDVIRAKVSLLDGDGIAVDYEVRVASNAQTPDLPWALAIDPVRHLDPDTDHTLVWTDDPHDRLRIFRTGAGPDAQPPPIPEVERVRQDHSSDDGFSCAFLGVKVDVIAGDEPGFLVVSRAKGALPEDPFAAAWSTVSVSDSFVAVGAEGCGWGWDDVEFGAKTTLRLGRFDAAGNFSGWSDPRQVRAPLAPGCSMTSEGVGAWGVVLVGVGLWTRRRRLRG